MLEYSRTAYSAAYYWFGITVGGSRRVRVERSVGEQMKVEVVVSTVILLFRKQRKLSFHFISFSRFLPFFLVDLLYCSSFLLLS